jgi:hypothetical protein
LPNKKAKSILCAQWLGERRLKMRTVAAIFLIIALAARAGAAEEWFVLSSGMKSCGSFVKDAPQGKEIFLSWAVGFISGANSRSTGNARLIGDHWDRESVLLWLENYCAANPLVQYAKAVEELRAALAKNQGMSNPAQDKPQ